jgi:transketolase
VEGTDESVAIRLAIGPSPRRIALDGGLEVGRGRRLRDGSDGVVLAYGPVLMHEALLASELLAERGMGIAVVDMPWLNRFAPSWLEEVGANGHVVVLEDHSPVGGLGDALRRELGREVTVLGVEGWPACGTPAEALRAHGLDGSSLASRIGRLLEG